MYEDLAFVLGVMVFMIDILCLSSKTYIKQTLLIIYKKSSYTLLAHSHPRSKQRKMSRVNKRNHSKF